jgi:hypothetical protein
MTNFQLIGVYRVIPTERSIAIAAKYHEYDWLIDDKGNLKDEITWSDFKNLGLLEFQVFGEYSPTELVSISQNDQSPYMEFYLDPKGTKSIEEKDALDIEGRRVCFFLHFINTSKPVRVGNQEVNLPALTDLPARLAPYTYYVPID